MPLERVPACGGAAAAIGAGEAPGTEAGQQLGQLEPSTSRTVGRPAANQVFLHLAGGSLNELGASVAAAARLSPLLSAAVLSARLSGCMCSAGWAPPLEDLVLRSAAGGAPRRMHERACDESFVDSRR